jgi:GNAT superfamily N-acetyltransferase
MWVQLLGDTRLAFIPYCAVDRVHQGCGVGQGFFAYVRQRLAAENCAEVLLWEIEVPDDDPDSLRQRRLRFYEKLGAQVVDHARGFRVPDVTACGELMPMWLMYLPVGDTPPANDWSNAYAWVDALLSHDIDYAHCTQHREQVLAEMRALAPDTH